MFISRRLLESYYKDMKQLDKDLALAAKSESEDNRLFDWLIEEDDVWPVLVPVFERRVHTRKGLEKWLLEADHAAFKLTSDQKRIGAFFIILEIREYAGHTLWNTLREPPHYDEIVKQVHERVAKRFKRPFDKQMSVQDRELSLSVMLLGESLEGLSPEKVFELLKESEFLGGSDYSEIKKTLLGKLGTSGVGGMKTMLGKTVAKRLAAGLIESAWGASRLAQAGRIGGVLSRVLPFALRRASLYVSLGFLLKDAYQLGGEATRITNPAVIIIALYRSFSDAPSA
ncbi:MAG: hypothetical protein H7249_14585 [Chitinophagaceae bacterium]|nr:hypothetical protein [Oligoflexus sp.]